MDKRGGMRGGISMIEEDCLKTEMSKFMQAAREIDLDGVLAGIENGLARTARDADGSTALMAILDGLPTWGGNIEDARKVLLRLAPLTDAKAMRSDGWTALPMACARGEAALIEILSPGSDASLRVAGVPSPLMLATFSGNPGAVEAALKFSDIGEVNALGEPALLWDSEWPSGGLSDEWLAKLVPPSQERLRLAGGETLLMTAARRGKINVLRVLAGHGGENAQNDQGKTALAIAAERPEINAVKELLSQGCDPNILDQEGNNALMAAASSASYDQASACVELLLGRCDPGALNHKGQSALELAISELSREPWTAAANDGSEGLRCVKILALATNLSARCSGGETFSELASSLGLASAARVVDSIERAQQENREMSIVSEPGAQRRALGRGAL